MPNKARILLKISGEALTVEDSANCYTLDNLDNTAKILVNAYHAGAEIAVVCGGGNILRGETLTKYSGNNPVSRGMHRADADKIGMLATLMNVLALQSRIRDMDVKVTAFSSLPVSGMVQHFNRHDAIQALEEHHIVLLAGGIGKPYFTTDSTAILKGLELECKYIIKGTKVDGVYDSDPLKNPNAIHFSKLTYADAIAKNLKIMDKTAFTLAEENDLKIAILRLNDENVLENFLKNEGKFSIISRET